MGRVLQITASLRIGGAEKVAKDIGIYAMSHGYEVHYLVFGDHVGEYEPEVIREGAKVLRLPSPHTGYRRFLKSLRRIILSEHYDIVHAHTMFNIGWTMMAAKQCGVPVRVAHAHSALDNGGGTKKQIYEKTMRHMILQNATDLIACGDAAGIRLFGEKAYRERGQCILNGIDTEEFTYSEERRLRMRRELGMDNDFVIGHVGHLAEVKNQSFLIRLMPEILKCKPNAKLLMLGEGADRPLLERQIRDARLTDRVIMTGNVRNVPDYLSAMDVFAFPSLFEGMPLSIVEVQANGLPCILSTGVPRDVYLTDLVRPLPLNKPQQWIDAICTAARGDSEKYADELKSGGFDTVSVMKKFIQIYERAEKN